MAKITLINQQDLIVPQGGIQSHASTACTRPDHAQIKGGICDGIQLFFSIQDHKLMGSIRSKI